MLGGSKRRNASRSLQRRGLTRELRQLCGSKRQSSATSVCVQGGCVPVAAVEVGRGGDHAHREEEPPPVDHGHGRRRQAAALGLEAPYIGLVCRRRHLCVVVRALGGVNLEGGLVDLTSRGLGGLGGAGGEGEGEGEGSVGGMRVGSGRFAAAWVRVRAAFGDVGLCLSARSSPLWSSSATCSVCRSSESSKLRLRTTYE